MPFIAPVRQDDYPATADTQCIAVHIPAGDEYKALLAGFIALLTDVNTYEDPSSAQADGVAATFDEGYSLTNWDGCGIPPECEGMNNVLLLTPVMGTITAGNQMLIVGSRPYYAQQAPSNASSYRIFDHVVEAGDWLVRINARTANNQGICKIEVIDSVSGTVYLNQSIDLYTVAATPAKLETSEFTLTDRTTVDVRITANGKNASSSNFQLDIATIELIREF